MARIEYKKDIGTYVQVYESDSLNEIEECLYARYDKLSDDESPELPIYVSFIHTLSSPQQLKHIGYAKLIFDEDIDGHAVHHYTVDRKELPEWSASGFYSGRYGFKED